MKNNKIETIMSELLKPAVKEETSTSNSDYDVVYANPDRVDRFGNDIDDEDMYYSEEDDEYENWIDETYSCEDEGRRIEAYAGRLMTLSSIILDDDHRYYANEAGRIENLTDSLEELVKELEDYAYEYSTYT